MTESERAPVLSAVKQFSKSRIKQVVRQQSMAVSFQFDVIAFDRRINCFWFYSAISSALPVGDKGQRAIVR